MLRLTLVSDSAVEVVLKVDGWLVGADVTLLEQAGESHRREGKRLVLELHGLKFIDSAGLSLLQQWSGRQLTLRGGSSFVQLLLRESGLS